MKNPILYELLREISMTLACLIIFICGIWQLGDIVLWCAFKILGIKP